MFKNIETKILMLQKRKQLISLKMDKLSLNPQHRAELMRCADEYNNINTELQKIKNKYNA